MLYSKAIATTENIPRTHLTRARKDKVKRTGRLNLVRCDEVHYKCLSRGTYIYVL